MGRKKKSVLRKEECDRLSLGSLIHIISVGNTLLPLEIRLPEHLNLNRIGEIMPDELSGVSLYTKFTSDFCMAYDTMLSFETLLSIYCSIHQLLKADEAVYYPKTTTRRKLFC